jgi:acetyltransferase
MKVGGSVLANLVSAGFPGRIVPVNPSAATVQGLAAAPSVGAIDGSVELAVITVPAADVLPALEECAAKGVGAAVVISAGFREIGGEGQAREAELRGWIARHPLRVVGPNCLGWIRPAARLNATFAPGMAPAGGIAFVSHSGALAVAILDWARERHLGFSLFASLGNQADVAEADVLDAVTDDGETRVVVLYLEGVADGRRLVDAIRRASAAKPVVVLKTGRSAEGARAVSSHTGALAGSDEAFDAAVRQAGAIRVRTVEELFDLADALETQAPPSGRRLLVVTNGGGLGVVATDAARAARLEMPPLADPVRARLRALLPPTASVANPLDLVGDADAGRYQAALEVLAGADVADALLVVLAAQAATDSATVARAIVTATRGWSVPVVASFVGGPRIAAGAAGLEDAGIPCYPFPERAVTSLAGMVALAERRRAASRPTPAPAPLALDRLVRELTISVSQRADATLDVRTGVPAGPPAVTESAAAGTAGTGGRRAVALHELGPLLSAFGIPYVGGHLVTSEDEAARTAAAIGFPVVLKLVSPDVTHKTEVGGVRLGLGSPDDVAGAFAAMMTRVRHERPGVRIDGAWLQPMVAPGRELLLGAVRDPDFGAMVVVGFGGVYVEVLKDTAARIAPVGADEARAMLDELRMAPLLHGVRGEPAVALDALASAVSDFSRLAAAVPALVELELNPLVASPDGVVAVDARATLAIA